MMNFQLTNNNSAGQASTIGEYRLILHYVGSRFGNSAHFYFREFKRCCKIDGIYFDDSNIIPQGGIRGVGSFMECTCFVLRSKYQDTDSIEMVISIAIMREGLEPSRGSYALAQATFVQNVELNNLPQQIKEFFSQIALAQSIEVQLVSDIQQQDQQLDQSSTLATILEKHKASLQQSNQSSNGFLSQNQSLLKPYDDIQAEKKEEKDLLSSYFEWDEERKVDSFNFNENSKSESSQKPPLLLDQSDYFLQTEIKQQHPVDKIMYESILIDVPINLGQNANACPPSLLDSSNDKPSLIEQSLFIQSNQLQSQGLLVQQKQKEIDDKSKQKQQQQQQEKQSETQMKKEQSVDNGEQLEETNTDDASSMSKQSNNRQSKQNNSENSSQFLKKEQQPSRITEDQLNELKDRTLSLKKSNQQMSEENTALKEKLEQLKEVYATKLKNKKPAKQEEVQPNPEEQKKLIEKSQQKTSQLSASQKLENTFQEYLIEYGANQQVKIELVNKKQSALSQELESIKNSLLILLEAKQSSDSLITSIKHDCTH